MLLSAVGIKTNIENIGLEEVGTTDKDKILVNEYYNTNIPGYYAIGDVTRTVIGSSLLEGINCVEKIAGIHVDPIDYGNVPGCTYASPEIASVGLTENKRKKRIKLVISFLCIRKSKDFWSTRWFCKVILMLNTENG
jgi:dihydrolipoamide dehydrogenase